MQNYSLYYLGCVGLFVLSFQKAIIAKNELVFTMYYAGNTLFIVERFRKPTIYSYSASPLVLQENTIRCTRNWITGFVFQS